MDFPSRCEVNHEVSKFPIGCMVKSLRLVFTAMAKEATQSHATVTLTVTGAVQKRVMASLAGKYGAKECDGRYLQA